MVALSAFKPLLGSILALDKSAATTDAKARALRAAGMLTKAKQGATPPLTDTDAINLTLVSLLDQKYGEGHAEPVKRARDLPRMPPLFEPDPGVLLARVKGLSFAAAATAGEALDLWLDDVRAGKVPSDGAYVSLDASGRGILFNVPIDPAAPLSLIRIAYGDDSTRWLHRVAFLYRPVWQSIVKALDGT